MSSTDSTPPITKSSEKELPVSREPSSTCQGTITRITVFATGLILAGAAAYFYLQGAELLRIVAYAGPGGVLILGVFVERLVSCCRKSTSEKPAPLPVPDPTPREPTKIHKALEEEDLKAKTFKALVDEEREKLLEPTPEGLTALHLAILMNRDDLVEILLNEEKITNDLNTSYAGIGTYLHYAVEKENRAVVEKLIDTKKLNVAATDDKGNTVLHIAAKKGKSEIFNYLRSIPGVCETKLQENNEGMLASWLYLFSLDIVKVNLQSNKNDKDIDDIRNLIKPLFSEKELIYCNKFGQTILHTAAIKGAAKAIVPLLEASLKYKESIPFYALGDNQGLTALHLAVKHNQVHVLYYFSNLDLEGKTKVNRSNVLSPSSFFSYKSRKEYLQHMAELKATEWFFSNDSLLAATTSYMSLMTEFLEKMDDQEEFVKKHSEIFKLEKDFEKRIEKIDQMHKESKASSEQKKYGTDLLILMGAETVLEKMQKNAAAWNKLAPTLLSSPSRYLVTSPTLDLGIRDENGNNLLHQAILDGNFEILDLVANVLSTQGSLISHFCAVNKKGQTPIKLAQEMAKSTDPDLHIKYRSCEIALLKIQKNHQLISEEEFLHEFREAIRKGELEKLECFINADKSLLKSEHFSPLHYAGSYGSAETYKKLVQLGSNPELRFNEKTVLEQAIVDGNVEMTCHLAPAVIYKRKDKKTIKDSAHKLFYFIAQQGHPKSLEALERLGLNPPQLIIIHQEAGKTYEGNLLLFAAYAKNYKLFNHLLKKGWVPSSDNSKKPLDKWDLTSKLIQIIQTLPGGRKVRQLALTDLFIDTKEALTEILLLKPEAEVIKKLLEAHDFERFLRTPAVTLKELSPLLLGLAIQIPEYEKVIIQYLHTLNWTQLFAITHAWEVSFGVNNYQAKEKKLREDLAREQKNCKNLQENNGKKEHILHSIASIKEIEEKLEALEREAVNFTKLICSLEDHSALFVIPFISEAIVKKFKNKFSFTYEEKFFALKKLVSICASPDYQFNLKYTLDDAIALQKVYNSVFLVMNTFHLCKEILKNGSKIEIEINAWKSRDNRDLDFIYSSYVEDNRFLLLSEKMNFTDYLILLGLPSLSSRGLEFGTDEELKKAGLLTGEDASLLGISFELQMIIDGFISEEGIFHKNKLVEWIKNELPQIRSLQKFFSESNRKKEAGVLNEFILAVEQLPTFIEKNNKHAIISRLLEVKELDKKRCIACIKAYLSQTFNEKTRVNENCSLSTFAKSIKFENCTIPKWIDLNRKDENFYTYFYSVNMLPNRFYEVRRISALLKALQFKVPDKEDETIEGLGFSLVEIKRKGLHYGKDASLIGISPDFYEFLNRMRTSEDLKQQMAQIQSWYPDQAPKFKEVQNELQKQGKTQEVSQIEQFLKQLEEFIKKEPLSVTIEEIENLMQLDLSCRKAMLKAFVSIPLWRMNWQVSEKDRLKDAFTNWLSRQSQPQNPHDSRFFAQFYELKH